MYENDFVDEKLVEFEVDGRLFKYKPITAGEELEWAPDYIEETQEGELIKRVPNLKKLTLCQMRAIVSVPYTIEQIKNAIGIEKAFQDLTNKEKDMFWSKMSPSLFDKIVRKLKEISSDSEVKKN